LVKKYKLVAFDLDGTLLVEKSSWGTLHEYFGTTSIARQAFALYRKGIIDYTEFMRRDISTWPKPLHMSKISELLSKYNLRDGAEEVVESIHSRGIETAIISAGINLLGYSIAKRLGIQHVYINELCIDENGFLTGQGIMKVDFMSKHLVLVELSESLGLSLSECIAVDDSIYNIKFLQTAGLGLYLCDGDISIKSEITTIKNLREILNYI